MRHSKRGSVFVPVLCLALIVPAVCLAQAKLADKPKALPAKYSCSGKEKLTIEKDVINVASGALVDASGKCTVVVKSAVINAPVLVRARDQARVKFKDCTINVSQTAIIATDKSFVELKDVVINGPDGIQASGNARVELEDVSLNATTAITAKDAAIVTIDDAAVNGKKTATGKARIVEEQEEDD